MTAFLTVFVVGLLVLAGLAFDGGLALAASVRANGQAEAAARAGAQELDLSAYRTGIVRLNYRAANAAAQDYLASAGATGGVHVSGNTVTVTITDTKPTQVLRLVGVSSIHYSGTATARPDMGQPYPMP